MNREANRPAAIVGWDIGAVNVKAACFTPGQNVDTHIPAASRQFEIWRERDRLPDVLKNVFAAVSSGVSPRVMAVATTAELSDAFSTKRQGVLFVLDAVKHCFPEITAYAFSISGRFVPLKDAKDSPLDFAATNWMATAQWMSTRYRNCLVLDVGSTTTDILPILDGRVSTIGFTDMARLAAGELVYTGALRTNLAAIVSEIPVTGCICRASAEYFAISGDVHLILGHLKPEDYFCRTPDGQPASVQAARRRLARLVCADMEMLSAGDIDDMARYIHARQVRQISDAINQVLARLPELRRHPVIVVGMGAFLGWEAARHAGLTSLQIDGSLNPKEREVAPCVALAHLLAAYLKAGAP